MIAIHPRSGSFSDCWIQYCEKNNVAYKIVNAYSTDIMTQVKGCDAFMWHHHHEDYRDVLFAKQLIYSLESMGIRCFPNSHTTWHFDDKVGQKYLLESIGAPLVPSYVFYTKQDAIKWVSGTTFPKVFKLRGGAGASNVQLIRTSKDARKLVDKAFRIGFSAHKRGVYLQERYRKWRNGQTSFVEVLKGIGRLFVVPTYVKMCGKEKGYVYFQDFIPNNQFDLRVVVIGGERAMGEKRYCREGDFRASGSGRFEYPKIDDQVLQIAFDVANRLQLQSVAFDFVYFEGQPLIVEISYGFGTHGIRHCGGYYTRDMQWHKDDKLDFCGWMVADMINGK